MSAPILSNPSLFRTSSLLSGLLLRPCYWNTLAILSSRSLENIYDVTPLLAAPLVDLAQKTTTLLWDLEYFIHTKFHQNPSSGSGEVENVNCLTDDGRTYNRRRTTRNHNGSLEPTDNAWSQWVTGAFGSYDLKPIPSRSFWTTKLYFFVILFNRVSLYLVYNTLSMYTILKIRYSCFRYWRTYLENLF